MRIAYFTHSIVPSAFADSVQSMNMCHALAKRGHDVTMYAPDRQTSVPLSEDVFSYYDIEPVFRIVKVPWVLIFERAYYYAWIAVAMARRDRNDLFYSRTPLEAIYSTLLNRMTIFEAHTSLDGQIVRRMFRFICGRASLVRIVTISDALAEHYRRSYQFPGERIRVARDATRIPALEEYEKPIPLELERGRINVGYTGSLYADKGIATIIRLADALPEFSFHVIGGTVGEVSYWRGKSTTKNIKFYGSLPPKSIPEVITRFDIVIAPYDTEAEVPYGYRDITRWMSPMKLFEYMAAGRPIVCSDIPVLREFMHDGVNALLCPPKDLGSWTAAIRKLAESPALRARLGNRAREEAVDLYSWEKRADIAIEGIGLDRNI